MSRTKAFLFDRLPQDEAMKAGRAREWTERSKEFQVRVPTRRKNPQGTPRWDPLWPSCLHRAVRELGIDSLQINDGLRLRTAQDRDAVIEMAETLLADRRKSIFGTQPPDL